MYYTYLYCTHHSVYIKAVPYIKLITEHNTMSYFAHLQSLFSLPLLILNICFLSLFLFSTWYQSHFLVVFTRQNPAFLRCYGFTVSSPRSQTLSPAFLRCYGFTVSSPRSQTLSPFLPSSKSSSPSFCLTQNNLHWIDLITIYPLRPKSAGSGPARAPTRR